MKVTEQDLKVLREAALIQEELAMSLLNHSLVMLQKLKQLEHTE